MRPLVLFLLIATLQGSLALSQGEETAISDLFQEWPFLGSLSPPWTSNSSEACNAPFQGLVCSDGPDQHILSLDAQAYAHDGILPESIGGLSWLQTLTLEMYTLRLPCTIGNLTSLQFLELKTYKDSVFRLPESLGNLVNLLGLELSLTGYKGGFPEGILEMKKLKYLSLGTLDDDEPGRIYSFYGSVPASFCDLDALVSIQFQAIQLGGFEICRNKLPNLEELGLLDCPTMSLPLQSLLAGRFMLKMLRLYDTPVFGPLELEGQVHLERLEIAGTYISGTLPYSLWNNINLIQLALSTPSIGGTLPTSIGKLTQLESIDLHETNISGNIPREIARCMLLKRVHMSKTRLSGTIPSEIGSLSNLTLLDLSSTFVVGTIPDSFSQLVSLIQLSLDGCNLEGTIPRGLLNLPNLSTFVATQGRLSGTIPDEISPSCNSLRLDSNLLVGSVPSSAMRFCRLVSLRQNHLSGQISNISNDSNLRNLFLDHNDLTGSLPDIAVRRHSTTFSLRLPMNRLSGTIPDHYRAISFYQLDLSDNQLEGEISPIIDNNMIFQAGLANNLFSGTIPASIWTSHLDELYIQRNFLVGTIPPLSPQLEVFVASGNLLHGGLDMLKRMGSENSLSHLDLSHNLFEEPPALSLLSSISFVSLASNNLTGSIVVFGQMTVGPSSIQVLDLSNNRLSGQFPFWFVSESMTNLVLANNLFSGTVAQLSQFRHLSVLDISNNHFHFDASSLGSSKLISILSASNNMIYGNLLLEGLLSLKYADFSHNNITQVSYDSIYEFALSSISVKNNPIVESKDTFEQLIRDGTLELSSTTTPSLEYQGVICSELLLGNNHNTQLLYDESIFSFQQCRCDRDHFGLPPLDCHPCDTVKPGSTLCSGNVVHIGRNYYVYNDSKSLRTEMCVSQFLFPIDDSRMSNCLGIKIQYDTSINVSALKFDGTAQPSSSSNLPSNSQLSLQCQVGSAGRLCTRCKCDMSSIDNTCYFPGPAGICEKCEKVFSPTEFIPISLVVFIVVVSVLSIVFYLILSSRRRPKELEWKNLSIGRRIFYRLIDATSFGQITIVVTFVQILVELTHLDTYALSGWLKVVNGESEGLGLRCLFPFVSNPIVLLAIRLILPIIAIAIVCISIGLAELVHRFRSSMKRRRRFGLVPGIDTTRDVGNDEISSQTTKFMIDSGDVPKSVPYPAMALATRTSISMVKFLYFGTTMATVEYFFYSVQKGTNKKYVQSVPWMSFEDARVLRIVSIPFIVVYLLGIPFGFVLMSWKVRHKISSPFVGLYFGGLFESFQSRLFWWELVNMLRKLAVALLLRGSSPGDSLQPLSISLILGGLGAVVETVKPWKSGIENFLDGIGSILLVLSLASNRLGSMNHSHQSLITVHVLDAVYIVVCVFVIVWRTVRDETSYEKEWKLKSHPGPDHSVKTVTEDYGPPLLNRNGDLNASDFDELS